MLLDFGFAFEQVGAQWAPATAAGAAAVTAAGLGRSGSHAPSLVPLRTRGHQNMADTVVLALPELTVSNEGLKMQMLANLSDDMQRSVKAETSQCGPPPLPRRCVRAQRRTPAYATAALPARAQVRELIGSMKHITIGWQRPIPRMRGLLAYMRILHMSDTDHRQDPKKVLALLNEVRWLQAGELPRAIACEQPFAWLIRPAVLGVRRMRRARAARTSPSAPATKRLSWTCSRAC